MALRRRGVYSIESRVVNTEVNQVSVGKANRFSVTYKTERRNSNHSVLGMVEETVNRELSNRYHLNCICFFTIFIPY